jgi:hypothetical protein
MINEGIRVCFVVSSAENKRSVAWEGKIMYQATLEEMRNALSMFYLPTEMTIALKCARSEMSPAAYAKFVKEVAGQQADLCSARIVKRK